jgi:hypothetical protein
MLKPFDKECQLELGIESLFEGKTWAFTVVSGSHGWQLGVAEAYEPGYTPIPGFYAHSDNYDEMADHADALNLERGIDPREGGRIVASSMGAGKLPKAA